MFSAHSGIIGRACGPDSPPTITHCMPDKIALFYKEKPQLFLTPDQG
jgi:hypothetical protein